MKQTKIHYRVAPLRGTVGYFPIDMLRYDGAYPADQTESSKIESCMNGGPLPSEVELVATFNASPNDQRWRSFSWHVTHVEVNGAWQLYSAAIRAHRLVR